MNEFEPRPTVYIPQHLQADLPEQGCILRLTLHDGQVIPSVCIDAKGMIYGVLIKAGSDPKPNPINFSASDIATVHLLTDEIPPGYSFA